MYKHGNIVGLSYLLTVSDSYLQMENMTSHVPPPPDKYTRASVCVCELIIGEGKSNRVKI